MASEGKEQVGRTDIAEECDGVGTDDEQGPILMEQLRYREGTRMSMDESCVDSKVTKRRQEARLGTGMYTVDESSPQIEFMGKSQDQHPETPLARTNKTNVELNQLRDRNSSLRGTHGTPDRTNCLIQYTISVCKIAAFYINVTAAPQFAIMLKRFFYVQDIGFLLLQEVTIPEFPAFVGCKAHVNAGANQNGTVAIFRDTMRSGKWTRCSRGGE